MALLIALVALAVGGLACWLSGRSWAASHRLAKEMVSLRDRLLRLEQARDVEGALGRPVGPPAGAEDFGSFAHRLEAVERRAREARTLALSGGKAAGTDAPRALLVESLRVQGYASVRVIEEAPDGRLLVEAEREEGFVEKGWLGRDANGGVRFRPVRAVRAFP